MIIILGVMVLLREIIIMRIEFFRPVEPTDTKIP